MVVSNCLATNFECSTYLLFKKKTWNYMCSARCFISYLQLICSHQNIKTPEFYHCSGRFYCSPPQHKNSHRFPPTFFQLKITVKIARTFLLQLADINTSSFHRLTTETFISTMNFELGNKLVITFSPYFVFS